MKKPLSQLVCDQLIEAIQKKTWKYTLPGIRALCEEMQVSKQTMMVALRLLEKSGYVEQASTGKPRKIVAKHSSSDPSQKIAPIVGIITYAIYDELAGVDQKILKSLYNLIDSRGFKLKKIVFKDLIVNAGAQKVESVVRQNPADLYVVLGTSPECSKVLKTLGTPIVYLGGDLVKGCHPRVGFSFKEICTNAIDYISTLGHTKIAVMTPSTLNRKDKYSTATEKNLEKIFASKGIPFSTYNCPRWGKTTSEFYKAVERLFAVTPPTAILLGDAEKMPTLISFLMQRGLRYPDDLSIIMLEKSASTSEFIPKLSYVDKPALALARLTFKEINKLLADSNLMSEEPCIAKTKLIIHDSVKPNH